MIYVRLFRETDRTHTRSLFSFGVWVVIVCLLWAVSRVIVEAIPVFNNRLSLIVSTLFPLSGDAFDVQLNGGSLNRDVSVHYWKGASAVHHVCKRCHIMKDIKYMYKSLPRKV